jgi:hypothetical protein
MNIPTPEPAAKVPGAGRTIKASRWALHPLLFGCLSVLMGYQQLLPSSDLKELARCLLAVLAGILAVQLALWWLFRQSQKPAIVMTLAIIFFGFFSDWRLHIADWTNGTRWSELARYSRLMPMMGILFLGVSLWAIWRPRRSWLLQKYLNVVGAVLVVATAVRIFAAPPGPFPPLAGQNRAPLHLDANPPDIYYIITDAYTSAESLKKFWGYDNSPFINFLTGRGFQVVKNARSNSIWTPICLSTYLNMNYPPGEVSHGSIWAQCAYYVQAIQEAEVPSRLLASGYDVRSLAIFAVAGQPRYYTYAGLTPFLGNLLWNKTMPGSIRSHKRKAEYGDINLKILSLLPQIAAERGDKPKFVYAHLMMPHPPYLFDKEGHRLKLGGGTDEARQDLYLGQLIYENTLLTNVISAILKNSKAPPIIVLQGDHGFRFLPPPQRAEEAPTILNALYLPGAPTNLIPPGMTPVNSFRLIFNSYFGEHYQYLPDHLVP